jgi:hypothetical protein
MMKIDLPSALCPVTTRRIFFCIRTSYTFRKNIRSINFILAEGYPQADRPSAAGSPCSDHNLSATTSATNPQELGNRRER